MTGRRASLAACAGLALLPMLANAPALGGWLDASPIYVTSGLLERWRGGPLDGLPGWLDPNAGLTMQALGRLAADQWLAGRVPWWNPYSGIGLPLAAEMQPAALFLPFILLMRFAQGLLLTKVALQVVAGLATWGLLRALGLTRFAAVLGGALFEMNGTFAFYGDGPMHPVAFLPLLLLGIERARAHAADGAPGGWAVVAAALALSLYAGFPETAYLDGLFAAAWAAAALARAPGPRRLALAGKIAAGGAAGLLLSAPAVWPFLHYLSLSELPGAHDFSAMSEPAAGLAPLLLPALFRPSGALEAAGGAGAFGGGTLSITLLFWAALGLPGARLRGLRWLLAAWVALCLARTFGVPVATALVNAAPLVGRTFFFRYAAPSQEMAAVVLAALALDDWRRGGGLPARRRQAAAAGALAAGAAGLAAGWPALAALPERAAPLAATLAGAGLYVGAAFLLAGGRPSRWRVPAAMLVVAECAALHGLPLLAGARDARIDLAPVAFLRAHLGLGRFYTLGPVIPNYGAYFGVAQINHEYRPAPSAWTAQVAALDPAADLSQFRGFGPAPSGEPTHADALRTRLAAYESLGVRYVVAPAGADPFAAAGAAVPRVFADAVADIYELPDPAPYFAAAGGPCTLAPSGREKVTADCAAPATLVRRELDFPGWRAEVDGRPAEVEPAGALFQAVVLPAGRSRVRFAYAPPHVGLCWAAAALGLAWTGLASRPRRNRARRAMRRA